VLGYCILVEVLRPHVIIASSQWALNRIQAERFIYSVERPAAVIVGSSLAFHLPESTLGNRIFNLSLAAVGPLTGLEVVERSGNLPQAVIIETNFLFSAADHDFVEGLYAPPLYQVRSIVRGLRFEYQPVNVILSAVRRAGGHSGAQREAVRADPKVVANMVEVHERELSRSAQEAGLSPALENLQRLVSRLEKRGTQIIFLEMPVHPRLHAASLERAVHDQVLALYPRDRYRWLMMQECGEPETTDGLHLTYAEAARYAAALRDSVLPVGRTDAVKCPAQPGAQPKS